MHNEIRVCVFSGGSKVRNSVAAIALLSLILLSSCSSGTSGMTSITPVHAATAYSNASVAGSYAFSTASEENFIGYIGTFTADGNGNITAGNLTITENPVQSGLATQVTCTDSIVGTYSIQSGGAGTATLMLAPAATDPAGCSTVNQISPSPWAISLEVAQQGTMITALENGKWFFAFTAVKQ